ncbi:MAG TPA: polysaccharide deacetylase [Lentisphaeria bacterium]|nr:MAG: hypothetical protein A2X45_11120 [Lentisphaerae bacterium GWF2_50_93]HCE45787.1 polysaccharide deacetylase [Lentisphaeria bacterium]
MKTFWTIFFILSSVVVYAADTNLLPNPGFEDGDKMWSFGDSTSILTAEAAHEGKSGLRVGDDEYNADPGSVTSAKLPVHPGQEVTLSFWAKGKNKSSGAYIYFYDSNGKVISKPQPALWPANEDGQWHQYSLKETAPANGASVAVWVHFSPGNIGITDYDDFSFSGISPDVKAVPPVPPRARAKPREETKVPAPRKEPAVIILKFDDLKQVNGKVHPSWQKISDFLESRKIKGAFGMTCDTLQDAKPEYVNWIKSRHDSGATEFWFHGWDHATHNENGKSLSEFDTRSYEEQKSRFDRSQKLALEKLGFAFETFGPGGGGSGQHFDAGTCKVMQDDPHMKAWLYPKPIDEDGKKLQEAGKVTILDRVWEVNTEGAVGVPDSKKLIAGYNRNPERKYFVLQGHPAMWAGPRFDEFVKIIDFLQEQKCVFMTPMEYVKSVKGVK